MKILLFGDSHFQEKLDFQQPAIEHYMKHLDPSLEFINWAVSGDTSIDLLKRIQREVFPTVDKVCVLVGTNDLHQERQVYLGEYQENLYKILQRVGETGLAARDICLLTPPPVEESRQHHRTNRLVGYYGAVIKALAEEAGTRCLDLPELFSTEPLERLLQVDGIHLTDLAYQIMAGALVESL